MLEFALRMRIANISRDQYDGIRMANVDGPFTGCGCSERALIGRQRHSTDSTRMARESGVRGICRQIAEPNGVVVRSRREQLAIGRECYVVHPFQMVLKSSETGLRGRIPQPDSTVF